MKTPIKNSTTYSLELLNNDNAKIWAATHCDRPSFVIALVNEISSSNPVLSFSESVHSLGVGGLQKILNLIYEHKKLDTVQPTISDTATIGIPEGVTPTECARLLEILSAYFNVINHWPEDFWISLSKEWDLNLWTDETMFTATLYKVDEEGNTLTDNPFRVFSFNHVEQSAEEVD